MPKKLHSYLVETKDHKIPYRAHSRDEAFAKFFIDVEKENVALDEIGTIIMLHDDKETYPFRTAPILFQMKLLSASAATSNIMAATGVDQKEADMMLLKYSFNDTRIFPLIQKLKAQKQ